MKRKDRSNIVARVTTLAENDDAGDLRASTTPQQRWEMIWQLSRDAYAFKGEPVAQPGLHQHIIRVFRRKN